MGRSHFIQGSGRRDDLRHDRVAQSFAIARLDVAYVVRELFDSSRSVRAGATVPLKIKAKAAYGDFLTLWKDADSDIPVLKKARAEYARLS